MTAEKKRLNALKKAQVMSDREKNALSDGVKKGKRGDPETSACLARKRLRDDKRKERHPRKDKKNEKALHKEGFI
jgi:hypothetical protein